MCRGTTLVNSYMVVGTNGCGVPPVERGRMGVRGPGGVADGVHLGQRHWGQPGPTVEIGNLTVMAPAATGGRTRRRWVRSGPLVRRARYARECLGVGGGLPERKLRRGAVGRQRLVERRLHRTHVARRLLEPYPLDPALREPPLEQRRDPEQLQRVSVWPEHSRHES